MLWMIKTHQHPMATEETCCQLNRNRSLIVKYVLISEITNYITFSYILMKTDHMAKILISLLSLMYFLEINVLLIEVTILYYAA